MSINQQDTKQVPFDPSKKFTIFGSWMGNFNMIKEEAGIEAAYTLFEAIAEYAMYGVMPDFSDISNPMIRLALNSTFEAMRPNIDTSRKRSKANFANTEQNEKVLMVINFKRDHPEASTRDIARYTGVPKSTVSRILKDYAPQTNTYSEDQHSAPETACSGAEIPDDPDDLPF